MLTEEHLTFAEALIAFRRRRGASKAGLARACEASWDSLHAWEKGTMLPNMRSFRRLVEALELTEAEVLGLLACIPCPSLPPVRLDGRRKKRKECPPDLEPLLGLLSDRKVGELAGLRSPIAPKRWREERGIRPRRRRHLSREEEARLAKTLQNLGTGPS